MKTDNFEQIAHMMDFSDPDKFYLVELIQRKKDIPTLDKSTRLIKTYAVSSAEYMFKIRDEITKLCDVLGCRASIYVNRRSYKNTARHMMKTLADYFSSDEYRGTSHLFTSEAAAHGCGDKIWIIDLDLKASEGGQNIRLDEFADSKLPGKIRYRLYTAMFDTLESIEPIGNVKLIRWFNTTHGWHFLVRPFDTRRFSDLQDAVDRTMLEFFPELHMDCQLECKKDAMLNLYIP